MFHPEGLIMKNKIWKQFQAATVVFFFFTYCIATG